MRKARFLVALAVPWMGFGCGTEILHTADLPAADGGLGGSPNSWPLCNGSTLQSRFTVVPVQLPVDIRYKRPGYGEFPEDERIAFSTSSRTNTSHVAWLNNEATQVHVTPIGPDLTRAGDDVIVEGTDVGGLVVHDDGFALLTRRADLGEPVGDGATTTQAAFWVRVKNGQQLAVPLTGTKSITDATGADRRDFSLGLKGRLAYNGNLRKYGAYFAVRAGLEHRFAGQDSDKLVYLDEQGQFLSGGWSWGACTRNLGIRLVAENFTAFCISDGDDARVNVIPPTLPLRPRAIAQEVGWPGYAGGQFGSAVKVSDGYLLGWLSRGSINPMPSHNLAWAFIANDYTIMRPRWVAGAQTEDVAEINLHLAPYGPHRVLLVWESIERPRCSSGVCYGEYGGTHYRLMDLAGNFVSEEVVTFPPSAATPNSADDIAVYPNWDLGWAFVAEERNFTGPLAIANGVPNTAPARELKVVRLSYCVD
jgi:hypothetical protein